MIAGALLPNRVSRVISISSAARSHPFSIAMRYAQRQGFLFLNSLNSCNLLLALMMDPNWNKGYYYDSVLPHIGMKVFSK